MNKYLYLPCLAILALASCDEPADQSSGLPQDQPQAEVPVAESALPQAVVPDISIEGSASVDPSDASQEASVGEATNSSDPSLGTEGNAGPSDNMTSGSIDSADVPPVPNPEVFNDATCDYEAWVGNPLDETAVKAEGRPYRIVAPGDPMTMDHNPERINVEHENGNVTRVWCG